MKFTISKYKLSDTLAQVAAITPKRTSLPVLEHILLRADDTGITLSATNLVISLTKKIITPVDDPGAITVPADKLVKFVQRLNSDITFTLKDDMLYVRSGRARAKFKTLLADKFPLLAEMHEYKLELEAGALHDIAEHVAFAASTDEVHPVLSCVQIKPDGKISAADGFRMAQFSTNIVDAELLIPANTLKKAASVFDDDAPIRIGKADKLDVLVFEQDGTRLTSQMIDGNYPDINRIIPQDYTMLVMFDRDILTEAVRRVGVFAETNICTLIIDPTGRTELSGGEDTSSVVAVVDATRIEGDEPLKIAVNVKFLLDALKAVRGDDVVFWFNEPHNPISIHDDDLVQVIMPMHIGG